MCLTPCGAFSNVSRETMKGVIYMAKKKTVYQKEVDRIKRQLKAIEKRGYITDNIKIPKSTKGAKNLTLEKIYNKAEYVDTETGEILTGKQGRELERSRSAQKARRTRKSKAQVQDEEPNKADIVMDNLLELINRLENADPSWGIGKRGYMYKRQSEEISLSESCRQSLLSLIHDEIRNARGGIAEVAQRLESRAGAGEIQQLVDSMLHGYKEDIYASYTKLASFITGGNLSLDQVRQYSDMDDSQDEGYEEE